jgi:hypothetical protein
MIYITPKYLKRYERDIKVVPGSNKDPALTPYIPIPSHCNFVAAHEEYRGKAISNQYVPLLLDTLSVVLQSHQIPSFNLQE